METFTAIDGTFERAEINFGRNKELSLSPYKEYLYVHISNLTNGRSVNLGTDELEKMTAIKRRYSGGQKRIRKRRQAFI